MMKRCQAKQGLQSDWNPALEQEDEVLSSWTAIHPDETVTDDEDVEIGLPSDNEDPQPPPTRTKDHALNVQVPLPSSSPKCLGRPMKMTDRATPCSPPVPIPRKRWHRSHTSPPKFKNKPEERTYPMSPHHPVDSDDEEFSTCRWPQSRAQLWDENWHFKLSLESRESFEAAAHQAASATDDSSAEEDVFAMDD